MTSKILTKQDKERIRRAEKKKRNRSNKKASGDAPVSRKGRAEEREEADDSDFELYEEQVVPIDASIRAVLDRFRDKAPSRMASESQKMDVDLSTPSGPAEQSEFSTNLLRDQQQAASTLVNRKRAKFTVAELKSLALKPDVVEAVDVTAADPLFLVWLKSQPNVVQVPRHWSSKRKYMANKRSVDRVPYRLPDYVEATGIAKIRAAVIQKEQEKSLKARQKEKIRPKTGRMDIDFKVLHDAFFKYQTKPGNLLGFGDLYYEGREQETRFTGKLPGKISAALREALGMPDGAPPPWLVNMQRFGPPPAYPDLKFPGVNAPIPFGAEFGYHPGGWGRPPLDDFGNPLFGHWRPETDRAALEAGQGEFKYWGLLEHESESESDEDDVLDQEEVQETAPNYGSVQVVPEKKASISAREILAPKPTIASVPVISESLVQPTSAIEELYRVIPEKPKLPSMPSMSAKTYAISAEDIRKQLQAHTAASQEALTKAHIVEAPKPKPKQQKFKF